MCYSQRNEPKSLERTKTRLLPAAGPPALLFVVLCRSAAQGRKQKISDIVQRCELRVEVKPGKAVFITVSLHLVL